jgi:hypothetical protein
MHLRQDCRTPCPGSINWCVFTIHIPHDDLLNPTYPAIGEPDLDPMRVERGAGQDLPYDPPCPFAAALVCFLDDIYGQAGLYFRPLLRLPVSVHGREKMRLSPLLSRVE